VDARFFAEKLLYRFFDTKMKLFLGKIQFLKNDNFFLGGITMKKHILKEYL
tara:strand:+ start:2444 stop:2596 length:153 start_codon:yes stop_codon:yes gene_type:complete